MTGQLAQISNPVIDKIGDPGLAIAMASGGNPGLWVLQLFLTNFIIIGFTTGSVIFFVMLLWGSVEYIMAGGDKERVGSAAKRISNALIGIVLLLSLFAISRLVNQIFGINVLKLNIPVIQ